MNLLDAQTAFAHLAVPFGQEAAAMDELLNLSERLDLRGFSVNHVAGKPDIIWTVQVDRFRDIFSLNRSLEGRHQSCQWILCSQVKPEARPAIKAGSPPGNSFAFFTQIRIHRHALRAGGFHAEQRVVEEIFRLLKENRLEAKVYLTVGWADILIVGHASNRREQLFPLLHDLQVIRYDGRGAIQRTVTLIGFPWQRDSSSAARIEPYSMYFRVKPEKLRSAFGAVEKFCKENILSSEEESFRLYFTGGKNDLLFIPTNPHAEFLNIFINRDDMSALVQMLVDAGVDHVESNLAFEFPLKPEIDASSISTSPVGECCCVTKRPDWPIPSSQDEARIEVETAEGLTIPDGIRESVETVYSLFRSTLSDPYQCCDMLEVIQSCDSILREIISNMRLLDEDEVLNAEEKFDWRLRYLEEMKLWCLRVEHVIGERMSDSYYELFDQTNRPSSHRGNVQKYLLTADRLIREFIGRVQERLGMERSIAPPVLHYGATDMIESHLRAGVVTIPSKYLFSLPLCIPQLWQEAGTRIFMRKYLVPYDSEAERRVRNFSAANYIGGAKETLRLLGDHFGDLTIRYFGLNDFVHFATYLVTLSLANQAKTHLPDSKWEQHWVLTILRLLYVYECDNMLRRLDLLDIPTSSAYIHRIPTSKEDWDRENREDYLYKMVSELLKIIDDRVIATPRYSSEQPRRPKVIDRVVEIASSEAYRGCHWEFLWDFVCDIKKNGKLRGFDEEDSDRQSILARIRAGEVQPLPTGKYLNAYLAQGYVEEVEVQLGREEKNIAGMVALVRSAYLSSYPGFRESS